MKTRILNNRNRRPVHPGAVLREDILPAIGLNKTELAERLGVSRQTINEVITEKRSMSIDLAYRIGRLCNMDGATFIRMQEAVDVWDTLQSNQKEYERITPVAN